MTDRFTISIASLLTSVSSTTVAAEQNDCDAGKLDCIRRQFGRLLEADRPFGGGFFRIGGYPRQWERGRDMRSSHSTPVDFTG